MHYAQGKLLPVWPENYVAAELVAWCMRIHLLDNDSIESVGRLSEPRLADSTSGRAHLSTLDSFKTHVLSKDLGQELVKVRKYRTNGSAP